MLGRSSEVCPARADFKKRSAASDSWSVRSFRTSVEWRTCKTRRPLRAGTVVGLRAGSAIGLLSVEGERGSVVRAVKDEYRG